MSFKFRVKLQEGAVESNWFSVRIKNDRFTKHSKEQVDDVRMICHCQLFEYWTPWETVESDSSIGATASVRLDMQKIVVIRGCEIGVFCR